MERRDFIALIGMASAMMPAGAMAEPVFALDSVAGLLPGSWRFASSVNTRRDGSTFDRWGENPRGIFMFDRNGNYTQIILGSESRVFGAKVFCSFGTYKVDESEKVLVTRIDGCSASKLNGTVQNRTILSLTKEELRYTNPVTASGTVAEARWKRVT